jgi:hypothetical protein
VVFSTLKYGGITFENYRGWIAGDTVTPFIDPNEAHFFPPGTPNLFKTFFAPADYIETVNWSAALRQGDPLRQQQVRPPGNADQSALALSAAARPNQGPASLMGLPKKAPDQPFVQRRNVWVRTGADLSAGTDDANAPTRTSADLAALIQIKEKTLSLATVIPAIHRAYARTVPPEER